jgi:hypothetical protein
MPLDFTKCDQCGMIFPSQDSSQRLCPKCRHEESSELSTRELLRTLKNALRDAQSSGVFFTVPELSRRTGILEDKIWHYIHTGEIDTASFNDPQVRDFLVKRHKERMKASLPKPPESAKPGEAPRTDDKSKAKISGFHLKVQDDKPK